MALYKNDSVLTHFMDDFLNVIVILFLCIIDERDAEFLYFCVKRLCDGFKLILSLSKQLNVSTTVITFQLIIHYHTKHFVS